MILDMQNIYIKFSNNVHKIDKKCNEIPIYILRLEQKFYISNKKRKQIAFFPSKIDCKSQIL